LILDVLKFGINILKAIIMTGSGYARQSGKSDIYSNADPVINSPGKTF
jgi:hypothetical protein